LTEAVCDEKIVISTGTIPSTEKIAERKTIVYVTCTDPTVIKMAGEKLKDQLFTRFGFLKPKPEDIQFVSIHKYYEPYMVISGKYSVDYYRKCAYTVKVDKEVREVVLLGQKFDPGQPTEPSTKIQNEVKLEGEERLMNEVEASLILDKSGQDVTLEKLPSAPSERNPKKTLEAFGTEEIAQGSDLDLIRARILKRPKDISRLVNELFEVNERAIIYTPRFTVVFRNARTGEEKALEFDGVTAKKIGESKLVSPPPPPPPPPP
jgi:hypothetical protein